MPKAKNDEARILDLLRRNPQGLKLPEIFKELRVDRKSRGKIEERLTGLVRRKLARRVRDRWLLPLSADLVKGRFQTFGRGFGFVIPESGGSPDVYVPARFAGGSMNGDLVEVMVNPPGRGGRLDGKVVRIVKKAAKKLLGTFGERFGRPYFVPFESPSAEEVPLVSRGKFFPKPGDVVFVDRADLKIAEVLGRPEDPGVDTRIIIRKYGLAAEFSEAVSAEAEKIAAVRPSGVFPGRADYRGWRTVTIDGETAQDFDDAVSIQKRPGGGWRLGVHIADVSEYVRPGSALDAEAYARGTSVYFPGQTLPMLPETLSNGLCSLRPREDRLAVSVVCDFNKDGARVGSAFHPSVIKTVERMTYASVFKILQGDPAERAAYPDLVSDLLEMNELAQKIRRRRLAGGSLDFDLVEPELVYQEGKVASIEVFVPNAAHKLIEEFMVSANVAVAEYLRLRGVSSLHRFHDDPDPERLEELRDTLALFHILLPPGRIASRDLQAAIRAAEGTPVEKFVNIRILRSLRLAEYSAEHSGHYGLGLKDYTHFTSPIRRYPDLVVHRLLKADLAGGETGYPGLEEAALRSSEQERKAAAAEKDLVEWRIYRFLKERLGDVVSGTIIDFAKNGLIVELDESFVSGLLAYDDLGGDSFAKRPRGAVKGKRAGGKYDLGRRLEVQIAAVDPMLRRMTLVKAEGSGLAL
ncbi:MAG: VacB/RNase II family 3'-5' exoribonuclease [Candidatus Aminicenantes bacterium]|nr:VacB/RNase II family 3'-5' exoribonuclease [Candidatus Aminicenantes bacterium]